MAYLKAYYPKNFITYLLSMEINDSSKTKQYIYEAKKNNIDIIISKSMLSEFINSDEVSDKNKEEIN